jgi:hypothetical protein
MQNTANELLARAIIEHNVPPWFLESAAMKAYVKFVSSGRYSSPSRYTFLRTIDDLATAISRTIQSELQQAPAFSLEQDGWSRHQRKFIGVTAGGPGKRRFISCFNIDGSENAVSQALGMHKAALQALGLSPDLAPDDGSLPVSKVSNITTDSASVMESIGLQI